MNLEELFEDLETQFDSALSRSIKPQNFGLERISASIAGNRVTLDRPVLGSNFVAGLVSGKAIWRFQPHRTLGLAKISFSEKPELLADPQDEIELLSASLGKRYVRYALSGEGQQIRKGRVIEILNGLILFESNSETLAVAVGRLAWLEVHAADN